MLKGEKKMNIPKKRMALVALAIVLMVGVVFASYNVWHKSYTVTVVEPIEVTVFHEPEAIVEPAGLGYRGLQLHIHNKGSRPLTITVSWTCNAIGDIVFSSYGAGYCDENGAVFGKGTMTLGETFTIYEDGQIEAGKSCWVTIQFQQSVPADCPAGEAIIDVIVSRG